MEQVQISAYVSEGTRSQLDELSRQRGLKKGFVIEQALLNHLRALNELPDEAIIPPRLVLGKESAQLVYELIQNPPEPTEAMKELMNGD